MSDNLILFGILSAVALILVFVTISHFKKKSSSWKGVVIDKGTHENVRNSTLGGRSNSNGVRPSITIGNVSVGSLGSANQRHVSVSYYVVVKTEQSEELKWSVSEGLYEQIKIGDRLEKNPGTMIPSIISSEESATNFA